MIRQWNIIACVIAAILATHTAFAQGVVVSPETNAQVEQYLADAEFEKALAEGMPVYRQLARRRYDLPAIHACARNLAIIHRAARETVALLSRSSGGGRENLLDTGAFYRSLICLGRVKQFPCDGLTPDEAKFLSMLHTATLRAAHQRVLEQVREGASALSRDYVFAYLLATRDPERAEQLLDDLPNEFQTGEMLQALAGFCASLDRKDLAAAVCVEGARRFDDEGQASAFCNSAAEYRLALNDVANAVEALKQIVARFPESDKAPETQLRVIDLIEERWKSYGTAAKECRAFLEKFPQSGEAGRIKLKIGYLYYRDRDFERAIRYVGDLAADPAMAGWDVNRRLLLAYCHLDKGEKDVAADILRGIVLKDSEHPLAPQAQYVLANSYLSRQQYAKARDELDKLVALYPNSKYAAEAVRLLPRVQATAAQEKRDAAEADKKKADKK